MAQKKSPATADDLTNRELMDHLDAQLKTMNESLMQYIHMELQKSKDETIDQISKNLAAAKETIAGTITELKHSSSSSTTRGGARGGSRGTQVALTEVAFLRRILTDPSIIPGFWEMLIGNAELAKDCETAIKTNTAASRKSMSTYIHRRIGEGKDIVTTDSEGNEVTIDSKWINDAMKQYEAEQAAKAAAPEEATEPTDDDATADGEPDTTEEVAPKKKPAARTAAKTKAPAAAATAAKPKAATAAKPKAPAAVAAAATTPKPKAASAKPKAAAGAKK